MTRMLVHRPARMVRPLAPPPEVHVAAPPQINDAGGGSGLQSLLPVVGAVGSMTMMLVLRGNPLFLLVGVMVLVVALVGGVGMALSHRGTAARGRRLQRERYLDYLEGLRADLREAERDARDTARTVHPDPVALVDVVRDPERRWERRRTDPDFLDLRIGVGDRPWFDLQVPQDPNPTQPFDPAMSAEAEAVRIRHGRVPQMPITVPLDRVGEVAIIGPRDVGLALVRALTVQAVALHAPDDLSIAAAFPADRADDWAWLGSSRTSWTTSCSTGRCPRVASPPTCPGWSAWSARPRRPRAGRRPASCAAVRASPPAPGTRRGSWSSRTGTAPSPVRSRRWTPRSGWRSSG